MNCQLVARAWVSRSVRVDIARFEEKGGSGHEVSGRKVDRGDEQADKGEEKVIEGEERVVKGEEKVVRGEETAGRREERLDRGGRRQGKDSMNDSSKRDE